MFRAAHAWVGDGVVSDVDIVVTDGVIASVSPVAAETRADVELPGVVLPGFANAHSHAFHRALRGRTHGDGGTFWTWRERMYELSAVLDPDRYHALARAVYGEMALAGVTCVGEFHYVHHAPGGTPYADPNAMGEALRAAARDAGIRLTLLDTCYLAGGLTADGHVPLNPEQLRFGDGSATAWGERVSRLRGDATTRIGAAIHSVRAVPRDEIPTVVEVDEAWPLHVHLSEQTAENDACLAAYGLTPTALLDDAGALSPRTTAVHATHLTDADVAALGRTTTYSCFCPTTERDLADGIGPAPALAAAGSPLCLGSDQHAVIDLLEEARALEMHERLVSHRRGTFQPTELMDALTVVGHRSLGWTDAGRIEPGLRADLVAVRLDALRTAGSLPEQVLLSAYAADVDTVVVDGEVVVRGARHTALDVAHELTTTIDALWSLVP
ncbi:MAG: formimidoylglutamate deiminase [Candidatus Nanopelagicales bacterium]